MAYDTKNHMANVTLDCSTRLYKRIPDYLWMTILKEHNHALEPWAAPHSMGSDVLPAIHTTVQQWLKSIQHMHQALKSNGRVHWGLSTKHDTLNNHPPPPPLNTPSWFLIIFQVFGELLDQISNEHNRSDFILLVKPMTNLESIQSLT